MHPRLNLTEIEDNTTPPPEDLLADPILREAIEYLQESAFSPAQLDAYDKYWDSIQTERTLLSDAWEQGMSNGIQLVLTVVRLFNEGQTVEQISRQVRRSLEEVRKILKEAGLSG